MPRQNASQQPTTPTRCSVQFYYELTQEKSQLEKKIKPYNEAFKKFMAKGNMKEFEENGYKLLLTEQDRSTMNDDRLVALLKAKGLTGAIAIKEVPVAEEVEQAVFEGLITPEEFASCMDTKKATVLNVKKVG